MRKRLLMALAAPAALVGCSSESKDNLPSAPPSSVTMVATGGFTSPGDAVASPDGKTFYFTAIDDLREPALFSVSSEPGSQAIALASGAPLDMPIGLVLSCDGETLYVADVGGDYGAVLSIPTGGGALTALPTAGLTSPGGLAMSSDCKTIMVTGRTTSSVPALFALATEGGDPRLVYSGEPLVSPTGVHIDKDGVSWVMDHLAHGMNGEGVLFAIPADGSGATEIISDLRMGTPGGVSLTAGGGTAVMPTRDANGHAQLTSVVIETGEMQQLATPEISDPAGLRTARGAAVFAVVDSEGGAIYRAE
jgi:DNA-binding beta-propeller fold protein YncE